MASVTGTERSVDALRQEIMGAAEGNGAIADAGGVLWRPKNIEQHQVELFRKFVNERRSLGLKDYSALHRWSCDKYADFWEDAWRFLEVTCSAQPDVPVVDVSVPMDKVPRWFSGARLNYAENLLRWKDDDKIAYYYTSERIQETGLRSKTFGQFRRRAAFVAKALRGAGVQKGDRVVGYLPNFPETLEVMAATASIGAVWSSTSPDFGVAGVLDRFRQIKPKIIFSVEAVSYNLKTHDHLAKLKDVVAGLEDLEKVVVVPFCKPQDQIDLSVLGCGDKAVLFSQFVGPEEGEAPEMPFEQVEFHHPLFILYSSGTTGAPKCMVHSVGGTLMKHLVEHRIQGNRGPSDVLFQYTTVGWMMWNWLVSALAIGTTLVLYDGSPLHPNNSAMWDLVDKCKITTFGTSAKWIAVQEERGIKPRETHKLDSLKGICSTGSPLMPHSYDYVYRDIKSDLLLASISGGSDIIACFMGEISVLPVHRGEIQGPLLGCDVQCWNDTGKKIEGEQDLSGELVIPTPFISMPVEFWNDPEKKLYHAAYFDKFDGVWAHGDFIHMSKKTGGIIMLGRSDGTLNPNGVRFGSAEIYSVIETHFPGEVADSLCVGQRSAAHGERVLLFVKLPSGTNALTDELRKKLKTTIRTELSARHVPEIILPIADIPYTVNGKKVEVAVKKILAGMDVKNRSALANPESLELYKDIPEVQKWENGK